MRACPPQLAAAPLRVPERNEVGFSRIAGHVEQDAKSNLGWQRGQRLLKIIQQLVVEPFENQRVAFGFILGQSRASSG